MAYDEKTAERVRKILAGRRDVTEKKMMGGLAFMTPAGMCCSVSGRGGLLIRAGADGAALLAEPHVQAADIAGRKMTTFVRVMADGYRTDAALKKWIAHSLRAVAAKPAKPAGRKAKSATKGKTKSGTKAKQSRAG